MKLERDAFYAMLGIAMRAGQLSLGESGVLKDRFHPGTALFMILDADASDNTKRNSGIPARFIKFRFMKRRRTDWGRPSASRTHERRNCAGHAGRKAAGIGQGRRGGQRTVSGKITTRQ